jgi:hypothetical protein
MVVPQSHETSHEVGVSTMQTRASNHTDKLATTCMKDALASKSRGDLSLMCQSVLNIIWELLAEDVLMPVRRRRRSPFFVSLCEITVMRKRSGSPSTETPRIISHVNACDSEPFCG